MLRRWQDEAVDPDDHDALETERNALSDALSAVTEQRDALSEAVRLLLEPEPDMERVHAILRGVGHD
jgi:DNA-binding protein YbaB